MRFGTWILSVLLLAAGVATQAASAADCISAAEMTEIASKFNQFSDLSGKEYCYDGSSNSNLLQSIMFMRNTPFAPSMPKSADELFSGSFSTDWWGYFTGRINTFEVQDDCPKGVIAFVYSFGGNTMYVCPAGLTSNFTSLDRASVFMHEARHIDGYPHITCDRGPRAGIGGACDDRITDTGSYDVTVETYAQIGEYAMNLHPALKAYAQASAVIYANEAFENPVQISSIDQFLLMTNKREFYKLNADGSAQVSRAGDASTLGHIVMRARYMVLYPDDKSLPAKFVFADNQGDVPQQAGDMAGSYNALSPADRAKVLEIHIAAQWTAEFFPDHVHYTCSATSADTQDVSTGGETPVAALYPNGYDRAASSALMITASGKIMEFGCSSGSGYFKPSSTSFDQAYKRIYKVGNEVLGLTRDGRLFQINGATSTPLQTSVDGQIFELVPSQAYAFFQ